MSRWLAFGIALIASLQLSCGSGDDATRETAGSPPPAGDLVTASAEARQDTLVQFFRDLSGGVWAGSGTVALPERGLTLDSGFTLRVEEIGVERWRVAIDPQSSEIQNESFYVIPRGGALSIAQDASGTGAPVTLTVVSGSVLEYTESVTQNDRQVVRTHRIELAEPNRILVHNVTKEGDVVVVESDFEATR